MTATQKTHGLALVTAAACIPVGEGVSWAALSVVAVMLGVRRADVDWNVLQRGATGRVLAALGVWLGAGLAAIVLGGETWLKPSELGRCAPFLCVPLVVLSATSLPRVWLRRAATAFVIALSVAAVFGLCQYFFNVRPGEGITRVDPSIASQGRVPGDFGRSVAGGFYFHRLKMAHVLLVGIGLLVARQLFAPLVWLRRTLEVALLMVMCATLLLTFTRAAFLGLAAAVGICIIVAPWRWRFAAFVVASFGLSTLAWLPGVRERLTSMTGGEASSVRALIWSQAVRIIADHPLGVGLGNYSKIVARYYDTVDPTFVTRTYPHSVLLAAWAEAGPVGMLAYAWLWTTFIISCARALKDPDVSDRDAAAAGLAVAAAFWTVGATHDVLYHNVVALAYASAMGLVLSFLTVRQDA